MSGRRFNRAPWGAGQMRRVPMGPQVTATEVQGVIVPPPTKPRMLVSVLCLSERGGWVNPWLVPQLVSISRSMKFEVMLQTIVDGRPWEVAGNNAIISARELQCEWLLILENDNAFSTDPMPFMEQATERQKVITFPYFWLGIDGTPRMIVPRSTVQDGPFFEIESGGAGALFIHSDVWNTLPGPWFKTTYDEESESHRVKDGHDHYFHTRVRQAGFKVWSVPACPLHHWHQIELGQYAARLTAAGITIPELRADDPREVGFPKRVNVVEYGAPQAR